MPTPPATPPATPPEEAYGRARRATSLYRSLPPIVLNQTVIPDYRLPLFEALLARYGDRLKVTCGMESPTASLRSCERAGDIAHLRRNIGLFRRQLVWQTGLLDDAKRSPLLITEFNMRAPSTWAAIAARHSRLLPTVLWGHAHGRRRNLQPLRRWMLRRVDGFIAYTETQARMIQDECPWLSVRSAPNAIMWERECRPLSSPPADPWDVIFVGRLTEAKKPLVLLDGFAKAVPRLPPRVNLVFVGSGPEADRIGTLARAAGVHDRIRLHGHVGDISTLRELYSTALVSVSPGYVGLSATQSFAFGVPMLVSDPEPHSPEIEACIDGFSAQFFQADNSTALAAALISIFERRKDVVARRESLSRWTAQHYTFEKMLDAFDATIAEFSPAASLA